MFRIHYAGLKYNRGHNNEQDENETDAVASGQCLDAEHTRHFYPDCCRYKTTISFNKND